MTTQRKKRATRAEMIERKRQELEKLLAQEEGSFQEDTSTDSFQVKQMRKALRRRNTLLHKAQIEINGKPGALLGFFEERTASFGGPPVRVVTAGDGDVLGSSQVASASRHLVGGQLGYDLTPEIRGEFLVIYDWSGRSASFFPTLQYAPLDWLELTLGAQLFAGPRLSQYGDAQPLGFLLAEAFF